MVEDKVSTELRKPFPYSLLFAASFGKSWSTSESTAGMLRYPKLPKLNSELWVSLPAHPPLQMQIADPSVAAKNMLDGSPEVQLRRKQTNDRTTRQKLQ